MYTQSGTYIGQNTIESIAYCIPEEQHTVQTTPIEHQTTQWLRELSLSLAIYELEANATSS